MHLKNIKDYRGNHHRKPLSHHRVNVQAVTGTETRIYGSTSGELKYTPPYFSFTNFMLKTSMIFKRCTTGSNIKRKPSCGRCFINLLFKIEQITMKPPHSNSRVKYLYPISLRWLCLKLILFIAADFIDKFNYNFDLER
uniref:Uncharacterized protein n=1 Tax=Glossina austeni TaxID=7395 RepID=A0A1A9VYM0_GLOAU